VLFLDEIHRFNKSQQDALLPHVEDGTLILIGATTENPSFEVNSALLSRTTVYVLDSLQPDDLRAIVQRALTDTERGLGDRGLSLDDDALEHLVGTADGDARAALNALELAAELAHDGRIDQQTAVDATQHRALQYDRAGEEHFNLISAMHKSVRGSDPDAALYWLARMLAAGEDPMYVARRLIRMAIEDIGLAAPNALPLAVAARDAYHMMGSPEGDLALAEVAVYLAVAPKSNSVEAAWLAVQKDVQQHGSLPVPLHIRNAPTSLMKDIGYGSGYQYAHDFEGGIVAQQHLPDALAERTYYQPTDRGAEAKVAERLASWREALARRGDKVER
jgi:putative ATPase